MDHSRRDKMILDLLRYAMRDAPTEAADGLVGAVSSAMRTVDELDAQAKEHAVEVVRKMVGE